jgi:CRISPR-associated endonuclease/helicase Cas3
MGESSAGKGKWPELQAEICGALESLLGADVATLPSTGRDFNTFAAFISGFVAVCDWIGSSAYFPFEARPLDLRAYLEGSRQRAQKALGDLEFLGWQPDRGEPDFESIFKFAPNDLQSAGIAALSPLREMPRLVLVEYPTGGGKTELALHIADSLINRYGLGGSYIAMPTQATSNQMFGRFIEYLVNRYPQANLNLHLIHGQADQEWHFAQMLERPQRDGDESGVTAEDWFQNRKRALLATFGVGTIDQAMLSVLQARHHFVRQFGLSQKVIIFDEIHSYDSYMNVIIEGLLGWLQALGTPMILLSATLARQNRQALLNAVGVTDTGDALATPYPRLTVVAHDGNVAAYPLPRPETRTIAIEAIPPDEDSLLDAILPCYGSGGCIAVVCNTVDEAIAAARLLRDTEAINPDDVWLFHARFPPVWRREIEADVLNAFGKDAEERPERAILVATQIIEQSLDLDFDLMISRTAPIDLLIQRVGRLHRHERAARPAQLAQPTLLWRTPDIDEDGLPSFGVDEVIYRRFFLLKTWLQLRDMRALRTPEDIDALMDYVYSEDCVREGFSDALRAAYAELKLGETNSAFRGAQHVLGEPGDQRLIGRRRASLPDDEERHVATRDFRPGIDLICLSDEAEMRELVEAEPSRALVAALLQRKVTVQNAAVKDALKSLSEHRQWFRKPQLRHARPILFKARRFHVPGSPFTLQLTRQYGLEFFREED